MIVKKLRSDLQKYLQRHNLVKKFAKQVWLFTHNPKHPSLNTELLEPRHLKIYSFRIDRKYRAIFILVKVDEIEIIDVNDHYQ
ncbi:MAG: hypothetical protein UZ21_OP11001000055 [Microgenomates bacterium OLB22]|nr:MAG: hypothetical protein UZ21_OP11001000055 [Microgenomates bacterium OLB22]